MVVIVTMKGAPLLLAVYCVIGSIEIQYDMLWLLARDIHEQVHEQGIDLFRVRCDALCAMRPFLWSRAPIGSVCWNAPADAPDPGRTGYLFAAHAHGQHRIVPQAIMVVHVFVAQAYRADSLPEHRLQGVLDPAGITVVREAGGQAAYDVERLVGLP